MAEARIVLIRHAETEWNRDRRIQGYNADSPLTAAGREQARLLAARLAREGIDALHSSDLGRTRQTTEPIAAATGLAPEYDPALRERNYGVFEGRDLAELESTLAREYAEFRKRDPDYVPPGGESAAQFRDRVVSALERIASQFEGRRVAVVTHGGVLGSLYRVVMDIPLQEKRGYALANASLNHFRFVGGRWLLDAWADTAHLDNMAGPDEQ